MDLIVDLKPDSDYDVILVIVNYFIRCAIFIPIQSNFTLLPITYSFFDHGTVRQGFLPLKFNTDRGLRIIKYF